MRLFSLMLMLLLCAATVTLAQDAPPDAPKVDLSLLQGLVVAVIPVLTGVILQFFKRAVSFIPNEMLPVLAPIVGVLILALGKAFDIDLTPGVAGAGSVPVAAALGSTSVGVHQVRAQLASR